MIDHIAIRAELNKILQHEQMTKAFWNKLGKTPVKKEVTRKNGTSFMETFYTTVKKLFKPSDDKPSDEPAPLYPGSFTNIEAAESVLGKPHEPGALSEWNDQLKQTHKEAIRRYSGFWYSQVNGLERGQLTKSDMTDGIYSQIRQCSRLLEEALDKYKLKQNIVVHRQVSDNMLPQFQQAFQSPDKLFIENGFFSTTVIKNSVRIHDSIDLVVKVPKGNGRGAYIKYLSNHPGENEFLINNHSIFTVDDIKKVNDRWQVVMSWKNRLESEG